MIRKKNAPPRPDCHGRRDQWRKSRRTERSAARRRYRECSPPLSSTASSKGSCARVPHHALGCSYPSPPQAALGQAIAAAEARGTLAPATLTPRQWGIGALVLGVVLNQFSPIYRNLTFQFKVYLQMSGMIAGGSIEVRSWACLGMAAADADGR